MKKDKSQKAITLIALIITIIILLILAGVTIITLTGENGLLNRAQIAKETNKNASINENTALNSYEDNIDNLKVDNSREDSSNSKSNINFYIDDIKTSSVPSKEDKYVYGYSIVSDSSTRVEWDNTNWQMNLYNIKDSNLECNVYFYEKDNFEVLQKILNLDEKYSTVEELYQNKLSDILNSNNAYNYIINSNGELASKLASSLNDDNYKLVSFQAYADGENTHSLTLEEGKYVVKISCNQTFKMSSVLVDGLIVEPINENMYIVNVKTSLKLNWYSYHPGEGKYLYVKYYKL